MIKNGEIDFLLYGGSRGGGKMTSLNTQVLTSNGFKRNGDLTLDDKVLNPETGLPVNILKIHPTQKVPAYKITFSDGTEEVCCKDHLWEAWRSASSIKVGNKKLGGIASKKVVTTQTIKKWVDLAKERKSEGSKASWPMIPTPKPLEYSNGYKPTIPPYLLGLLLGDGCITNKYSLSVTSMDEDIINYVVNLGATPHSDPSKQSKSVKFIRDYRKKLTIQLTELKLLGTRSETKFIPEEYLHSDVATRRELLQGLLDTDGSVSKEGWCYYYSVSKDLISGVKSLVESLGGVATLSSKIGKYKNQEGEVVTCKRCYNLFIKHKQPETLFKLERKIKRTAPSVSLFRKIVDIKVEDPIDMQCITVDSDNGLYICNKSYLVTHNSELLTMVSLLFNHDKYHRGIFFRRHYSEIMGANSLWQKASNMYPLFNAKANKSDKTYTFPSGAI